MAGWLAKVLCRVQTGRQALLCGIGVSLRWTEGLVWALVHGDGHTWVLALLMGLAGRLT